MKIAVNDNNYKVIKVRVLYKDKFSIDNTLQYEIHVQTEFIFSTK